MSDSGGGSNRKIIHKRSWFLFLISMSYFKEQIAFFVLYVSMFYQIDIVLELLKLHRLSFMFAHDNKRCLYSLTQLSFFLLTSSMCHSCKSIKVFSTLLKIKRKQETRRKVHKNILSLTTLSTFSLYKHTLFFIPLISTLI
ncbi:hypothetical protein Hdeb2414_s0022g00618531 [Helianthus debilis subsp. tardiflorus]